MWASTTVSATMRLASANGIQAFATGGIGGVHHGSWDVSQDILELSRTRIIVVSAGPKSILDLPGTSEMLESFGVVTVGFQTDAMPAFYSRASGINILPVDSVGEVTDIYQAMGEMGNSSGLLVFNPIPAEHEIADDVVHGWVMQANEALHAQKITGKGVTPFLLRKLAALSDGQTVASNKVLLENNVKLGCDILNAMAD